MAAMEGKELGSAVQSHEMQNLLRVMERLGRTVKERVIINSDQVKFPQPGPATIKLIAKR